MWKIRTAREEDAEELSRVARDIFYDTFGASNSDADMELYCSQEFTPAAIATLITDPQTHMLLATHDGRIIGYAQVRRGEAPTGVPGCPAIELKRFYIAKAWHGAGLARALMSAVADRSLEDGMEGLWLGVWEHNLRAIRFYRKCGFNVVGELPYILGTDLQRDFVMASLIRDLQLDPVA